MRHGNGTHGLRTGLGTTLVAALALGTLAGCTSDDEPSDDVAKTITIGINYHQPGVGLLEDGVPRGFDVDVAAYVAWKLGHSPYAIEWVEATYEKREQLLTDGNADLVVATYSITDERDEKIDFAGPYIVVGQDLLVAADDTSIAAVQDLAGKSVCSVVDTTSLDRLRQVLTDTATIVEAETMLDCTARLAKGEVDAMSTDDLILAGYAATDDLFGKVRLVGAPFSQEPLGIGLPSGSKNLCERVNAALSDMVEDGSWQKFIDRHTGGTGFTPKETLNPPTPRACG